ncbi:MAG TPA: helix-turn-helix transcriptional regulator, partial [Bacteroidales bacterium]|nr:helix-turn-helix transcriptional regulator [Bacteroidales bacterium]
MEITVHHSIADLYETLGLQVEQDTEFVILSIPAIHPRIPFQSPVLRADYFSFILTIDGSGVYCLDDNRFPFGSGTFFFTNPGHIKSYELHRSQEAFIITLTENFLREYVRSDIYAGFPFLLAEIAPPVTLSPGDLFDFTTLYRQMTGESGRDSFYKNKILGSLFSVLLFKVKEKFWSDYDPKEEGNRDSRIVRSFKELLEKEFRKVMTGGPDGDRLQAQDFAERLSLHPNYLNAVIKSKTGRTVNEWISRRTLSAAKSLLLGTPCSSKQIAYMLGFSEPTHFSRFFRKHTCLSPGIFR